jgi:hypothetical protein
LLRDVIRIHRQPASPTDRPGRASH